MANRIAAAGALIGLLLAGCGGGSRASAPSSTPPAPHAMPPTKASSALRCHGGTAYGRILGSSPPLASALRLPGVPDGIGATPDGHVAFVALQSGAPRIAVIARTAGGVRLVRTEPIPVYASGVRVTPDGRYALAAAGRGAVVLDAAAAASGARAAVIGDLAAPAGVAGAGPGAAEVAISPDSRYAFVTLESAGVVAVFDLRRGFGAGAYVGAVPVGPGALGIAASPDGRWLYAVSESGRAQATRRRGTLRVISVARAIRMPASAVVASASVPCAPVRVALSLDGATVWVAAREGNELLGFSAAALRSSPARALLSATPVGSAPLGLAVVRGGRTVLVADSNLSHAAGSHAGVTAVDSAAPARPTVAGSILTGTVADAIATGSDGAVAFVTVSGARELLAVRSSRLP